jgi:hypothetical protein
MRRFFLRLAFLTTISSTGICFQQADSAYAPQAAKEAREKFRVELKDSLVLKTLQLPLSSQNRRQYENAFGFAELGLVKDSLVKSSIKSILKTYILKSYDDSFYRSAVEAAFTLFPKNFVSEIFMIANLTENPKLFAMCINYLMFNSDVVELHRQFYKSMMKTRFPDWEKDPVLKPLEYKITTRTSDKFSSRPPVEDLLARDFGEGNCVIYSFQRYNRDYAGLAVIKGPDGKFVMSGDSVFYISQFARSITNLPGYITNGNTPQGILSITGLDTSKNVFIGPTPNIQLLLPYEDTTGRFFHGTGGASQSIDTMYKNLLPESWRRYFPIYEALYAGKAGRSEIIAHGTTIDPAFYANEIYYPQTPSLGCLCCFEKWDENGMRTESAQQRLIDAFRSTGCLKGFVVVVELDSKPRPVAFEDIRSFLPESVNK